MFGHPRIRPSQPVGVLTPAAASGTFVGYEPRLDGPALTHVDQLPPLADEGVVVRRDGAGDTSVGDSRDMSEPQVWEALCAGLGRTFLLESVSGRSRCFYLHHRTGVIGVLAFRALPFFPDRSGQGLLTDAGVSASDAATLSGWAAASVPAGILLQVGPSLCYYWRADVAPSWPSEMRAWPTEQAIGRTHGKWQQGSFDATELAQCLISPDGYPFLGL